MSGRAYNEGVTVRLKPDHERALEEMLASGRIASLEEAVACALEGFLEASKDKPIWEELQEIRDSIDPQAFDDLPADSSLEHDHYLYGTPKRRS